MAASMAPPRRSPTTAPSVSRIEPGRFIKAEAYHQDFMARNPAHPYILIHDRPKLESLAYRNPLEALAEKYHASPALLKALNPGATFTRAGERIEVPNVAVADPLAPAPGARPAAVITVSKATSSLTVEDMDGNVLFHAPVTTGSAHDPLPVGEWKVTGIQRNPPFHYNPDLFWDADPKHSKARIAPGPNNPVGTIWIDITKEHYGIHGTSNPGKIGKTESNGCIRMTNWSAAAVAKVVAPGMVVSLQE